MDARNRALLEQANRAHSFAGSDLPSDHIHVYCSCGWVGFTLEQSVSKLTIPAGADPETFLPSMLGMVRDGIESYGLEHWLLHAELMADMREYLRDDFRYIGEREWLRDTSKTVEELQREKG